MNLIIHDLNEREWTAISEKYKGWEIISDNGTIKPCVGCFGCWLKDPGQCVMKDGYNRMGALIHKADEVVVVSRYTYGGFSSFVKNVFDRSIGWVLPFLRCMRERCTIRKDIRRISLLHSFSEAVSLQRMKNKRPEPMWKLSAGTSVEGSLM